MRILFVCSLLLLSGCSHMDNDSWSGQDKAQHFIASAMLSAAGNEYSQHQGMSRDRSAMFGLMFSVSLGASKELWDSRPEGSGWSWKDLAWDVAGASTGYTVWQLTCH
ncbi:TPA: YfiM family lipoprotein [Shigella dysenteriae]